MEISVENFMFMFILGLKGVSLLIVSHLRCKQLKIVTSFTSCSIV